jgi:hypothetical protein
MKRRRAAVAALLGVGLLMGCARQTATGKAGGEILVARGYRIASSLPGGSPPGKMVVPQNPGEVFVVVTAEVPVTELAPTEDEFSKLRAIFTEYGRAGAPPKREELLQFQADRFSLVLSDGRMITATLMAGTNYLASGFSPSGTAFVERRAGSPPPRVESVEVAFVTDGTSTRPPFKIAFRGSPAVSVPGAGAAR